MSDDNLPAAPPKRGRGRPRKILDEKRIFELARIMCSYETIASNLGVSTETVRDNYSAVVEAGRQEGKRQLLEEAFKRSKASDKIFERLLDQYVWDTHKNRASQLQQQNNILLQSITVEHLKAAIAQDKFIQREILDLIGSDNADNGQAVTESIEHAKSAAVSEAGPDIQPGRDSDTVSDPFGGLPSSDTVRDDDDDSGDSGT